MEKTIFDSFELPGVWWHPSQGERHPGVLKRTFNSLELSLHGDQVALHKLKSAIEATGESSGILFGTTSGNSDVTLSGVIPVSFGASSGGVVETECYANSMIVGAHLSSPESTLFRNVVLYFSGTEDWLSLKPIKCDFHEFLANSGTGSVISPTKRFQKRSKCRPCQKQLVDVVKKQVKRKHTRSVRLEFSSSGQFETAVDAISAKIRFSTLQKNENSKSPARISFQQKIHFEIEPFEEKPLEWFDHVSWQLNRLLRFLFSAPVRCEEFKVIRNMMGQRTYPTNCQYFPSLALNEVLPAKPGEPLFSFKLIQGHWPEILNRYFEKAKAFHNCIYLLSSDITSPPMGLENRFLVLAQCLEGITRAEGDQAYIPQDEYEAIRKALSRAIPEGIDDGLKSKIKSMLRYGNEKSLRKRLGIMLSSLAVETRNLICNKQASFVGGIIETRNFWTHVLSEKPDSILEDDDLYYACEKMQTLAIVLLAIRIGVPELIVQQALLSSYVMQQKREQFLLAREC